MAGDVGPRARVEETDTAQWQRTLDVNLNGTFYCIRQVVPSMKAQREGAIVNIASSAARTGLPLRSAYVASKAGVLGLSYNLARELGPHNIRCNAVIPGVVDNARARQAIEARARDGRHSLEDAEAELLEHVSMRTWIAPGEVADMVLFLSSPQPRHVTGQAIGVDGNLEWEA